jgi:hypothetical protein
MSDKYLCLMPSGELAANGDDDLVVMSDIEFYVCCCCPTTYDCFEDVPDGDYGWNRYNFGDITDACMLVFFDNPFEDEEDKPDIKYPRQITARFTAADSENCDGPEFENQTGTASITFYMPRDGYIDQARVWGNVEQHNIGYDESEILLDGDRLSHIISTKGDGLECEMEPKDDDISAPVEILEGCHTITFRTDTGDGAWHSDMVHRFNVYIDYTEV